MSGLAITLTTALPTMTEDVIVVLWSTPLDLVLQDNAWKAAKPRRAIDARTPGRCYTVFAGGARRTVHFFHWDKRMPECLHDARLIFDEAIMLGVFRSNLLEVRVKGDSLQVAHPDLLGVVRTVQVRNDSEVTLCHLFGRACGLLALQPLVLWRLQGGPSDVLLIDGLGRKTNMRLPAPTTTVQVGGRTFRAVAELSEVLPTFLESI